MKTYLSASLISLGLVMSGHALAQTKAPTPPAATSPVQMDSATEAKFKAADPKGSGFIEGAALKPFEPMMKDIDTDKDGKISRAEYAAAVKTGLIK